MGNSVVGKEIKEFAEQKIQKPIDIYVERLDSLLPGEVPIPLVKMDAQGFECHILDGMSWKIAGNIRLLKFEFAMEWLRSQSCMDLLPRLRNLNFTIISQEGGVVVSNQFICGVCDLYGRSTKLG